MKETNWTGALNGDASVGVNWDNGVPAAGDTVNFNQGAVSLDANADAFDLIDLAELRFSQGYKGDVAASGAPLKFNDVSSVIFESGGDETWLDLNDATELIVAGGSPGDNMLQIAAGTVQRLIGIGGLGKATIADGVTLTSVDVSGAESLKLIIGDVTGLVDFFADSGQHELSAGPSGEYQCVGRAFVKHLAGSIGTLVIRDQAVLEHLASEGITFLRAYGPNTLFDARQNYNAGPMGITDAEIFRGATVDLRNGMDNYIFVNPYRPFGGVVLHSLGDAITA